MIYQRLRAQKRRPPLVLFASFGGMLVLGTGQNSPWLRMPAPRSVHRCRIWDLTNIDEHLPPGGPLTETLVVARLLSNALAVSRMLHYYYATRVLPDISWTYSGLVCEIGLSNSSPCYPHHGWAWVHPGLSLVSLGFIPTVLSQLVSAHTLQG